jgi:FkbM family methyltransferase
MSGGVRIGTAHGFRERSWLERCADRLRGSRTSPAPDLLRRLHETVLDTWPGDHLVSTLPEGERVRLAARHRSLTWNPDEYHAFRATVRPGAVVFDVGANLGAYTMLFAQWAGATGRVFAFEPSPASLQGLRRHLRLNSIDEIVDVVPKAVCDRAGRATFFVDRSGGTSGLHTSTGAQSAPITVETTSLDRFCLEHHVKPAVIKIDVEGAELEVLRGARSILAGDDVTVFVELHPSMWAARGVATDQMAREIAALGFVPEPLDPSFDVWSTEGVAVRLRRR